MKLLTLNTHSLCEENQEEKCEILCSKIFDERPDIAAFQEVNQHIEDDTEYEITGHIPVGEIPLKKSNYALSIQKRLIGMGLDYQFSWLGMKKGYDRFDEGVAIFSKSPIKEAKSLLLSNTNDYNNFKKRMALLVETEKGVFVSCHLGFENDPEEPFENHLGRINACYNFKKSMYLLGDFNVPPKSRGYEMITKKGWYDTFALAEQTCGEGTVLGKIDGWEDNDEKLRIDYIFANKRVLVKKSEVIFDGESTPQISDHFGVMVTI